MSDIRNLLPDPKPSSTAKWSTYASKDISLRMLTDHRLHVTNNADIPDSYIYTQLAVPAGTYRFGAEVSDPQGGYASNLLRMVVTPKTELDSAVWNGKTGRVVTPPNKVDTDSTIEFRVMVGPTAGSKIWVRHLFVMTDSDYQQMIDAGIEWFDGDSHIDPPPADWIGHLADRHHLELEVAA